ncbi:hypothetical protein Y032_0045g1196 [Ancylostoma ceylanicum]|uniref:Uncharacterized protein n=1 Tax=Ancylostoma ceylanicum TaxID=53326 RepID=A0A016UCD8_9BILA|nr:hypothetical protein Y032_0045g1196 [Ancylostoma ceylanicum]
MLASCAVAAASGFLIYYYCDNEQESVSVVDAGRDYGMRSSAGAQSETIQARYVRQYRVRCNAICDILFETAAPLLVTASDYKSYYITSLVVWPTPDLQAPPNARFARIPRILSS